MAVMIGVDPHKGSHTAVALDDSEQSLGEVRVRVGRQPGRAAAGVGGRVRGADVGGRGRRRARLSAGPAAGRRRRARRGRAAEAGARVRLLATGDTNKNDPNDARSVAVAALRSTAAAEVRVEDHAAVMKVWAKRHRDLCRHRTRVACRLHAVLCELIPGGFSRRDQRSSGHPAARRARARRGGGRRPATQLAVELVADLRRSTTSSATPRSGSPPRSRPRRRPSPSVFGVGPIIAATVIGDVGDVSRFPTRDRFAAYNGTAPIEVSSGPRKVFRLSRRGNRRLNHAIHMAAVTQIRHRHSDGRAYYDRKIAEGHTGKEAIRALKRRISDAIYARLRDDALPPRSRSSGPGRAPGERL